MAMNWLTRALNPCNVLMARQTPVQGFGSGRTGLIYNIWEINSAYIKISLAA